MSGDLSASVRSFFLRAEAADAICRIRASSCQAGFMSRWLLQSGFNLGLCAAAALLLLIHAGEARAGSMSETNLPEDWRPEREVLRVAIELKPDAIAALRKDPRQYV